MNTLIVALTINWYLVGGKHILEVNCGSAQYQWIMSDKEFNKKKDNDFIKWFDEVKIKCEGENK